MTTEVKFTQKQTFQAALISLLSNIALTIMKLIVGFLFRSQVLIADGIHNAGDVIASATALSAMRISKQPADDDHPYGHGKAEVVGAGVVSVILVLAGLFIGYESVKALFEPPEGAHVLALVAASVSLLWKQWLYLYTIRIGKATNSKGLIATAYDHLADVYASIAAVVGIGLSLIGDYTGIVYLAYGDPISGLVVAVLILKLSYEMGRESIDILMEKNVSHEQLGEYAQLISTVPHVKRIDRLRARGHGHYIMVDVRVGIPGELTVQDGHDVSRLIKQAIKSAHKNVDEVLVHINPWYHEEIEFTRRNSNS